MPTFAQKQNQPEKRVSSTLTRSNNAAFGPNHYINPTLHLQRVLGNQAALRLLDENADSETAGKSETRTAALTHFAHDFSRVPIHSLAAIHSPAAGAIQTKLAINRPGDEYEQEAEGVSEQIMRMPGPKPQRKGAGGGSYGDSRTGQPDEGCQPLQLKRVGGKDSGQTAAPPLVHEVLRSPGQPLDAATRAFMEPRFGHDFSHVRVHSGTMGEQSARAINAHAYTVGHDIVFGAGQFAPETHEGRQLLAHELTHTVQQSGAVQQSRQMPAGSAVPMLQRQPAQTSSLPEPASDPPPVGYEESAHAPSYRVRVIAHASPRWRGATDAKNADQLNLELSKKRADEVGREVETLLAKLLPTGSSVSVQTSADLQEDTVGVEEEAHGSQDTLQEAQGNRADNAQKRRRVDVYVSSNQVVTGSGGASRPLLRRPTASKFWHVSVDLTEGGSVGAAGYLLAMTLTNDNTGEMMQGKVWSAGGGPKASIGASYSLSDSTGFMTAEPMDFEDFEGELVTYESAGISFFLGYSWSYLTFRGLHTAPKDINVGGSSAGTVGVGGSVTSGAFHFDMAPAYPPTSEPIEHTGQTEVPYMRTERGEDKYQVLFSTGGNTLSTTEVDLLKSFLTSVVASKR